jgi:hypothetical protein
MSQHPPKVRSRLLSYLCGMEKPKKHRRRTLVIIDGESLSHHAHYDFSFLESEKRLDVWFFFKNKIRHSFSLHKDYNAKNIVLPRYEEDTLIYIIKRVCYELGRREEVYHKLYFIGDAHPLWEGLVQFFRERGYVAHHLWSGDYKITASPEKAAPEERFPSSPESEPTSARETQPLISPEHLEAIRGILKESTSKGRLSQKEFAKLLHHAGISIGKNMHHRTLKKFINYLVQEGLVAYDADAREVVILLHDSSRP